MAEALLPGQGYKTSAVLPDQWDQFFDNSESRPTELDVTASEMNSIMSVLHAK